MISTGDLDALPHMRPSDQALASIVFVGDWHWRKGPRWKAAAAFLFGPRQRFEHLGMQATVAWWRDQPYLIRFDEAEAAT